MKKIFLLMALLANVMTTQAKETITLVYSWTAADTAANFYRALADEANSLQNKYAFVVDYKPGAGGTVAANATLANAQSALWLNSSAAFIRPNLYATDSHNMADFRSMMPMCTVSFVVLSSKYRSWREVPRSVNLSIGMTGLGTTTHLISIQVAKNFPNMVVVPFKSTSEALVNVLSGTVDFSVGVHSDSEQYTQSNQGKQVYWLGQTGQQSIKSTELLVNQGFSQDLANMNAPHQIFAARKMSEDRFRELRGILVQAARSPTVTAANLSDNCIPNSQLPDSQLDTWFNNQISQWKRLTQGLTIAK
jgi:tripartite-type tricarboxylate transporter receptor subunit TctC